MNLGGAIHLNKGTLIGSVVFFIIVIILYRNGNSEMRIASQDLKNINLINLKELLIASIDAAKRGGAKVYKIRMSKNLNEKSKGKTKEGANDPVTDGDILSHLEMFYSLEKTFPSLQIISEEKEGRQLLGEKVRPADITNKDIDSLQIPDEFVDSQDIMVWIDPLDATKEYTENLQQYVTTMVCVAVRGRPIIGVINKPFSNTTVWAWADHILSNSTVNVSKKKDIPSDVRIIVSRSHKGEVEKMSREAFGNKATITGAGGAGYKTLEVVEGNQDVYFHSSIISKWDICAGNAILEHLQGRMTTLNGERIDYSSSKDVVNPSGLVATLYNHDYYIKNLAAVKS